MNKIKFSLATNFSSTLIDGLKGYSDVYELYGRMKDDVFCGGRPNNSTQDITKEDFEKHVQQVRTLGINFNYLFNGSCLNNKEQDFQWQKNFLYFLSYLIDVGVNAVTITNPLILMLVKKHFPNLICRISTFCCIDTIEKAIRWENLGADILCLDFVKVNRQFNMLKTLQKKLKHSKIELLATNSCIKDCPFIHTHVNNIAHASDTENSFCKNYIDWCLYKCQSLELKDPTEYIRSPWIRPEDLHYYEDIGIEHIKLTERGFPTEALLNRLKAYHNRKYDGNLLDLIQAHGCVTSNIKKDNLIFKKNFKNIDDVLNEIFRIRGIKQNRNFPPHVFIENKAFDNFLSFFVSGKCKGICSNCSYCDKIAQKTITINKEITDYLIKLYDIYESFLLI